MRGVSAENPPDVLLLKILFANLWSTFPSRRRPGFIVILHKKIMIFFITTPILKYYKKCYKIKNNKIKN